MIDFRRLFDRYRIEWKDRGPNTSRGNINISCVLCNKSYNKDNGFHLGIFEATGEWHCFRNPKHSGHSIAFILKLLNIPESEYSGLKIDQKAFRSEKKHDKDFSLMRYFQPAEQSVEALSYLEGRLFTRPVDTCQKFKLLVDKEGKWAGRLIIPLTIGWIGRSMREHIEPRYDAYTTEDGFFLYKQSSTSCLIFEGSIDAMRAVSVSSQFDVIGKCGNRLSSALLKYLREAGYMSIYNIPDGDVPFIQHFEETKTLRSYCTKSEVKRLSLPEKDLGVMVEGQARRWIIDNCN